MKNLFFSILVVSSLLSCSSNDDNNTNNNPYITAPPVNLSINLNLPEYNDLNFPAGSVIISNQGIKGIVVYCVTENQYTASELTDPNHLPNSCSKMEILGIIATCPCNDDNKYDIITGQYSPTDNTKYPMIQYRAVREGNVINVFN